MSKNQGRIMDVGLSAFLAVGSCLFLSLIDFHPAGVFVALVNARYGKLTLARRIAGFQLAARKAGFRFAAQQEE